MFHCAYINNTSQPNSINKSLLQLISACPLHAEAVLIVAYWSDKGNQDIAIACKLNLDSFVSNGLISRFSLINLGDVSKPIIPVISEQDLTSAMRDMTPYFRKHPDLVDAFNCKSFTILLQLTYI